MLLREKAMSCHFGLRAVITRYLIAKFIRLGNVVEDIGIAMVRA